MRSDPSIAKDGGPKTALVFPPAMFPTSPPLGLACLKAFLMCRENPCEVRLFDLNLAHFEQALRWLRDGRLKMALGGRDHAGTARAVAEVCDLFKGSKGFDAFLDIELYNSSVVLYRSFGTVLNGLFEDFARKSLLDIPVPALVENYFRELLEPLKSFQPDLVGFSILFSQQLFFSLALAKSLKESGVRIVLGGATLSVMPDPERLLGQPIPVYVGGRRHILHPERALDYLLIGEGESGLAALVEHWNGDLSGVPGLVHVESGSLKCNPPELIDDLSRLPLPDFSDLPPSEYHSPLPLLPYLSSRGCFWGKCAFCTHQKTYLAYREEPVEQTVNRLEELKARFGVHHFNLVDEMIHPNRFASLGKSIMERGLKVSYSAYAKPTGRFGRSLLERVHRSGARVIMWGVESGNQRVLDAMTKGTRIEDMEKVLCEASEVGIWNLVFLLIGFPSETREEWEDTLRLLEKQSHCIDALSKSSFVLLAGSEVMKHPERYGISEILDRPERDPISIAYDYRVSEGMSQEDVQELYRELMDRLNRYGRSPHFGMFRDHMLLHASSVCKPK